MPFSTLVPVYHYIGPLYTSISPVDHYTLLLVSCFYICDGSCKILYITFLNHIEQFALVSKSMHQQ